MLKSTVYSKRKTQVVMLMCQTVLRFAKTPMLLNNSNKKSSNSFKTKLYELCQIREWWVAPSMKNLTKVENHRQVCLPVLQLSVAECQNVLSLQHFQPRLWRERLLGHPCWESALETPVLNDRGMHWAVTALNNTSFGHKMATKYSQIHTWKSEGKCIVFRPIWESYFWRRKRIKLLLTTRCLRDSGLRHQRSQLLNPLLETSIKVISGNILSTITFNGLTFLSNNVFEGAGRQIYQSICRDNIGANYKTLS